MMTVSPTTSIYLYTRATDMRKSFCGLSGIVREQFGKEPTDGSWFLFINRRRDRIKILYWDSDGLALWYKRLEAGTFETFSSDRSDSTIKIDSIQLAMILNGISLQAERRKRFEEAA